MKERERMAVVRERDELLAPERVGQPLPEHESLIASWQGARTRGADVVCRALIEEGVATVFGYPGGAVIPLYDAIPRYPFHHVLVRHEQMAAHMADGYARATGKVGVCIATSGPGATNLVTGIATAMMDSSPMVAITGNVIRSLIGRDGFQETDIIGVTLPVTKHNFFCRTVEEIAPTLKKAFHLARTGRPGPVLVDIPKDCFLEEVVYDYPRTVSLPGYRPTIIPNHRQIKTAAKLLRSAEKPLIIAGQGVILAEAAPELLELAEKCQIPVVNTWLGLGSFPENHPLSMGLLGMHGHAHTNRAVNRCDVMLAVGMRFDDRATGRLSSFARNAKVIHMDIDPAEIGKNVRADVPVVGDAKASLGMLLNELEPMRHDAWLAQIGELIAGHPPRIVKDRDGGDVLSAQYVIERLSELTDDDALIATDVGQHQMWVAQYYIFNTPRQNITSGGLGSMGFGLPAAMGVQAGRPEAEVWSIVGDGGFQMSLHELQTIVQEGYPVKIGIINNGYLGMVRQWQDLFHQRNRSATPISSPDYMLLAKAYGIPARLVTRHAEVDAAIRWAQETNGPVLIDFQTEREANVYPMVGPGFGNEEMVFADPT
jgi:acetolactate synthase-1/2/3 large subunit